MEMGLERAQNCLKCGEEAVPLKGGDSLFAARIISVKQKIAAPVTRFFKQ